MTYVVSDLHGSLDKFNKLLNMIKFNDNDVMYVLGDIVDYGEQPIELLCDLSMRYNVIPIVGDHDFRALKLLSELDKMIRDQIMPEPEILAEMTEWIQDGGQRTMEEFKALDEEMREGVLEYLLVHAGIAGFDPETPIEDYMPEDFIYEPLDRERKYFDDVTVIAGHLPTYEIDDGSRGRIFRGEGSIIIDCGAAFDETLGCLCLETGKEYYI